MNLPCGKQWLRQICIFMQALDFYTLFPILLPIHVASSFSQPSFLCANIHVYICLHTDTYDCACEEQMLLFSIFSFTPMF